MTPEPPLRAATAGGAELLGMDTRLGALRPGLLADIDVAIGKVR